MNFIRNNWRELVGWLAIFLFGYLYLFKINSSPLLEGRTFAPYFLLITLIIILFWLKVNKVPNR